MPEVAGQDSAGTRPLLKLLSLGGMTRRWSLEKTPRGRGATAVAQRPGRLVSLPRTLLKSPPCPRGDAFLASAVPQRGMGGSPVQMQDARNKGGRICSIRRLLGWLESLLGQNLKACIDVTRSQFAQQVFHVGVFRSRLFNCYRAVWR